MENVHDEGVMLEERSIVTEGMVPVSWPVTYGSLSSGHFLSKGMILLATESGFHVSGTTPVEMGMRLHLRGGPPSNPAPFFIRATLVWVQEQEFGLDIHSLGVEDQQWLLNFLEPTHRQSLLPQAL